MDVDADAGTQGRRTHGVQVSLALALVVMSVGIWLRVVAIGKESFWLDEVFSAAFADLSAAGTVFAVLLLDVHPPVYYLQLNAWGLFGHGDIWLRLNSVFWSTATLLAVLFGTTRRFGGRGGLLALMLCAVMGGEIYFAHELRMYPMAGCLAVLSWIAADRMADDYRFRTALPLIVVLAVLGAIHSASVIAASAALLYVFPSGNLHRIRSRLPTWFGVAAAVVCTYLPWIVNASSRNTIAHASEPSLQALSQTVGGWIIGYGETVLPSWVRAGATLLVAFGLLAALLACPRLSRLVVCFLIWPLLFGAIFCVIVQPIWLDRTFAFCAPFVAIAFGAALGYWLDAQGSSAHKSIAYAMTGLFAALILASGWLAYQQSVTPNKPDQFREMAEYLAAKAAPGEVIYAPRDIDFWGVNRYLIGPDWGNILKFEEQSKLDGLKRWRRMYALLGPARLERLGFMPETRRLDGYRIPLYTGVSPLPELPAVTGEWLVSIEGAPLSPPNEWHLCADHYPMPIKFGRLELYHWSCEIGH